MKNKSRVLVLIFIFLAGLLASKPLFSQVLQKLDGLAISSDLRAQKLQVLFEHPVTGENLLKIFEVVPSTNFKNAKSLKDIKPNDPLSIDYKESENGSLEAVYIAVIPLKKLPFTAEEVRKKLLFWH